MRRLPRTPAAGAASAGMTDGGHPRIASDPEDL
jgi:hypothetical protein